MRLSPDLKSTTKPSKNSIGLSNFTTPAGIRATIGSHQSSQHQRDELLPNPLDRRAFLGIPTGDSVAHAKDCQRCQTRIELFAEFPAADALANDALEDLLQASRPFADAAAARVRQELALGEEYSDEVPTVQNRGNVRPH